MRRAVLAGVVVALSILLVGVLVFLLEQQAHDMTYAQVALIILGLLPLALLGLALWSRQTPSEQAFLVAVELGGLALAAGFLYAGLPRRIPDSVTYLDVRQIPKEVDLGPFVPTPQEVVDRMLEMAQVTKNDLVYDLGCGDGRMVITAAKRYGARGVGVDIDPERVKDSKENVARAQVEDLVEIRLGDALKVDDIDKATVVALYILPEAAMKLRTIFREKLRPGTRIVTHDYDMGDWDPDLLVQRWGKETQRRHQMFLWTIREQPTQPAAVSQGAGKEAVPAELKQP